MNLRSLGLFAAVVMTGLFAPRAEADVVVTGTPGAPGGSVRITHDITFKASSTGTLSYLLLDDVVPAADGSQTNSPFVGNTKLYYKINGGATQEAFLASFVDNLNGDAGDITANDSLFIIGPINVFAGDTLTVLAHTAELSSLLAGTNPAVIGTFKGRAYFTNNIFQRRTDLATVNYPTYLEEKANEAYAFYAGLGQTNLGLAAYYELIALARYHFFLDLGDMANAEFNFYKFKGLSLKHIQLSRKKPKLGKYFQYLNLGTAYKRFWTIKGNRNKGQQLFVKYRAIALAARR